MVIYVKCLGRALGVTVMSKIRNWDTSGRCENGRSMLGRVDQSILNWFETYNGWFTENSPKEYSEWRSIETKKNLSSKEIWVFRRVKSELE